MRGAFGFCVHEEDALLEPELEDTVTTNVCEPGASALYDAGDVQSAASEPSSEQVVLVGELVVVQANVALVEVVEEAGVDVSVTVGLETVGLTVHENESLSDPPVFETLTLNVCGPVVRKE